MKHIRLNIANPLVIYTTVWLLVLLLTSLHLTTNLLPVSDSTLMLVLSNIVSFWLIYLCLWPAYASGEAKISRDVSLELIFKLSRFTKRLLVFWAICTIGEIIYFRGVPLLWAFQGIDRNYIDFGIPTLHGLLNAIYFFSVTALFLKYLVTKKRKTLFFVFVLLGWPVLAFARSVLLGVVCQMAGVYLMLRRPSIKSILKFIVVALIVVWVFGFIGDLRGTQNPFKNLVDQRHLNMFERLPSGFLWFYVYMTSPLSNIISNIDTIQPTFVPYYSIINLAPTVIRNHIAPSLDRPDALELVVENLNVSTFYAGFLSDFGIWGSILYVAVLQFFIVLVYFHAKRKEVWAILAYAVLFQCIVFSIFYNLLFSQVYLIQIFIALYFWRRVRLARVPYSTETIPSLSELPKCSQQPIQCR